MRLRVKKDFHHFARRQIQGGIWHSASWWEAVAYAPPQKLPPPVNRKKIPKILLKQDQLMDEFIKKNPALAVFDVRSEENGVAAPVATAFVAKQVEFMERDNMSTSAAYDATVAWLLERGPEYAAKLNIPTELKRNIVNNLTPKDIFENRKAIQDEYIDELNDIRRTLNSLEIDPVSREKYFPKNNLENMEVSPFENPDSRNRHYARIMTASRKVEE